MDTPVPLCRKSLAISNTGLYIGASGMKGRGVFAARDFEFEDTIEICPLIILDETQVGYLDKTEFYNYYFEWDCEEKKYAVALGYGSLYNHSYSPNARYIKDYENNVLVFKCYGKIKKGEEIYINYNCDPTCKDKLWFHVVD